jgi:hypothetical protein
MRLQQAQTPSTASRHAVVQAVMQRFMAPSAPSRVPQNERQAVQDDLRDLDQRVREIGEW